MPARTRALFSHCPAMVVANEPISTTKKIGSISLLVTYNIITFSRKGVVRTFVMKPVTGMCHSELWLCNLLILTNCLVRRSAKFVEGVDVIRNKNVIGKNR
jgi:hypothetical protein